MSGHAAGTDRAVDRLRFRSVPRGAFVNAKSIILKKRSGGRHTREELRFLIEGALAGRIAEYHLTAWMMAVFFQGM
ncbi:MAG: hypothetical protein KC729_10825, partial [Candidatus Eisenbacteria bacterium]|nr:hypothetical protein [Candidatus Eisenbacteria bacterium]